MVVVIFLDEFLGEMEVPSREGEGRVVGGFGHYRVHGGEGEREKDKVMKDVP